MQQRKLGSTPLAVSAVGLGGNNFGGRIDLDATRRVVHRAIDLGYPIAMVRAAPEFTNLLQDERFQHLLAAAHEP